MFLLLQLIEAEQGYSSGLDPGSDQVSRDVEVAAKLCVCGGRYCGWVRGLWGGTAW